MPFRRLAVALAAVSTLALAAGCQTLPLEQQPWIEVKTEHFRIVSQVEPERALKLAGRLERFRLIVARVANAKFLEVRVPTTIVLFDDRAAYLQFARTYTGGVFMPSQRDNFALVEASGGDGDATRVLLHEYTHFLVNNNRSFSYPGWYNEGFADLMAATFEKEKTIAVGRRQPDRVIPIEISRELPLRRVMSEPPSGFATPRLTAIYYAKAWHLVHYLMFGAESGFPDRAKQLGVYLRRVHDGMAPEQACQEAFGVGFVELDQEIDRYIANNRIAVFELPLSALPALEAPRVRSLAADEVAAELGAAALRAGNAERAESFFRTQLAARPDGARAHIGLADALRMQKRKGEYAASYERGLELGSGDALVQLDYAEYLMAEARGLDASAVDARRDLLARAREHLARAIALDPALPEAHAQLGATYLAYEGDEDVAQAKQHVEQAYALLASDVEITFLMALAHFEANELDEASNFIRLARSRAHSEQPGIEKLAAQIEAARTGVAAPPPGAN
jgi:tetratricopeptide (TPR) repeat protein